tara:strand:- start:161 stop:739 length:579 start_codon:yes stop_codon:yes gene_type:complete
MLSIFLITIISYVCIWCYTQQRQYKSGGILKINLQSLRFKRKADTQVFEDVNMKEETYKNYRVFYFLLFGDYNYKKFVKRIHNYLFYMNNLHKRINHQSKYTHNEWRYLENKIKTEGYAPRGEKDYLIVSKDLCIIEGHHRVEILKNLGYTDVLARVTNTNYTQLVFYKHLQYFPLLFIVNIIQHIKQTWLK